MTISLLEKFVNRYGRLPTEVDPDYLEMLRMGKYRLLSAPDTQPGKCCSCGASKDDGRGYVDVGMHIEWYGALFFCSHCLRELATGMGLFDLLEAELTAAREKLALGIALQQKGVELHGVVVRTFKELEDFYVSLHTPGNYSSVSDSPNLDTNTPDSKSTPSGPKSRTVKSSDGSGRKDLPSLTDLINSNNNS